MKKITIIILCLLMSFLFSGCKAENSLNIIYNKQPDSDTSEQEGLNWPEISSDGLDEEMLIENVDGAALEEIATSLQELTDEIETEQRENPEFAMSAEWYTYALESNEYKEIVGMGNKAAKALYLIIYKSPNQGLFEYICAMALNEITGFDNDEWKTSKEFLNLFNQFVLGQ